MTCPGVPDFYQGTELWDFNLVDPDNRQPVDYRLRSELLARVTRGSPEESKLFVIWRTLQFRNRNRDLFDHGDYAPITATGSKGQHVCAFARTWKNRKVIVVAPRLVRKLCGGKEVSPIGEVWAETTLDAELRDYQNVFTGEAIRSHRLADILKTFPIALLASG